VHDYTTNAIGIVPMLFEMMDELNGVDFSHMVQQQNTHNSSSNTTPSSHSWTKPPTGALKCNVDTACYIDQILYGVGACIRDAQERFVQAFTKKFDGKPEVAEAGAVGLLEAM
ncbi:hypothetical protein L195_g048291, partial [Trifolium pratense]